MLSRRKFPLFSGRAGTSEGSPELDESDPIATERRVLPRSRIYERSLAREGGDAPTEVACAPVKKLRRTLGDRKFHSLDGLVASLGVVDAAAAVAELVRQGLSFDLSGSSVRMRARLLGEEPQSVLEIFDGVGMGVQSEVVVGEDDSVEVVPEPISSASGDAVFSDEAEQSVGLVLSDPPEALTLPLSMVGSMASAILAKRGSGKTYLGMVLVEEILAAPEPPALVVFDPTGVWWGLLATMGGAPAAREIMLLGGPRGHLPLSPRSGARVADAVAQRPDVPVILDLSETSPAEQHEVCAGFCERLLGLSKFAIHVVFDEADEFAPQRFGNVGGQQRRSLGFVERLVMRGRVRGIGLTLISLRPAVLSKNVLSQVDALYLMRMVEPNDLRAVSGWLENFERNITPEQRSQCLGLMPVLPVGTAYFLRGGEEAIFRRFRVRRKRSWDSSQTPGGGRVVTEPRLLAPSSETLATFRMVLDGGGS